jgi:opacity protein-like surface antigen
MKLLATAAVLAAIVSVSPALAQTEIRKETWYNVLGEPFIVYQDEDHHWRGWDGPHAVDVIVHGSLWNKWGEGTAGGIGIECYPDYLLHMKCD